MSDLDPIGFVGLAPRDDGSGHQQWSLQRKLLTNKTYIVAGSSRKYLGIMGQGIGVRLSDEKRSFEEWTIEDVSSDSVAISIEFDEAGKNVRKCLCAPHDKNFIELCEKDGSSIRQEWRLLR